MVDTPGHTRKEGFHPNGCSTHGAFEASKRLHLHQDEGGQLVLRNIFKLLPLVVAIQGGPTILMHTLLKIIFAVTLSTIS